MRLQVFPPFYEEATEILVEGEHADFVASVLIARLQAAEYEVFVETVEGELVPYEEFEQ